MLKTSDIIFAETYHWQSHCEACVEGIDFHQNIFDWEGGET